jgi:glycosyltransferase involved in cell wall biosynthesis
VWKYLKKFYDRCNQIYVPTLSIAEELRSHRIQKNLKIWPRGINAELFIPSRRSEKWRKNLGVESHEILISFVSRLVLEKGLNVFISVIRELKKKNIPHKCVIVGEGPAKPVLQKEIPHAVFTGYLKGEDLATAYASSDIFLFPSPTETFGNVVLEAMACGVPVVGANAGGSRSLIRHGKTGYLANPEDAEDFIRYVVTLMEDEILRQQFSTRARMESKDYCWEKILKRMIHYYQETVSRFAPSPFQRG